LRKNPFRVRGFGLSHFRKRYGLDFSPGHILETKDKYRGFSLCFAALRMGHPGSFSGKNQKHPSGAKARLDFAAFTARLKPRPDTELTALGFFGSL
jgi:hypothetical protein